MIALGNDDAQVFVPDGVEPDLALERTTHMAVGAHPDDLALMAFHGISECFGSVDRWFLGVTVTDGAGSARSGRYRHTGAAEMRRLRAEEEKRAAVIGEYGAAVLLEYTSSEVRARGRALVDDLVALMGAASPRIVYTHNLADRHDTHVGVALATIDALRELPARSRPDSVYGCEVWRDLDWLVGEDKVVFDVSDRQSLAATLIGVYDTQISGGKRFDRGIVGRWMAQATFSDSHEVDRATALSFAMDLTPLMTEDIDPIEYVDRYVSQLRADIAERVRRIGDARAQK